MDRSSQVDQHAPCLTMEPLLLKFVFSRCRNSKQPACWNNFVYQMCGCNELLKLAKLISLSFPYSLCFWNSLFLLYPMSAIFFCEHLTVWLVQSPPFIAYAHRVSTKYWGDLWYFTLVLQNLFLFQMSNNRLTKILVWNIRGLNSQEKWDALRAKIAESDCQILCLQETKREHFDLFYLKKFCPRNLDKFVFFPSTGSSGGLITIWNGSFFDGTLVQANSYAISVNFCSLYDNKPFLCPTFMAPLAHLKSWLLSLG